MIKWIYDNFSNVSTDEIREALTGFSCRSAWARGVRGYALDFVDDLDEMASYEGIASLVERLNIEGLEKVLLNGADNWSVYSWGGCSLIYNEDIAQALCTPSELKKTDNGRRKPNGCEDWLDVQARALWQACRMLRNAFISCFACRRHM